MAQYISKDILMSQLNIELSNLHKAESEGYITKFGKGKLEGLEGIADFISNFCDKEVDLEKEFYSFLDTLIGKDNGHLSEDELFSIAEHFYELGVKVSKKGGEE